MYFNIFGNNGMIIWFARFCFIIVLDIFNLAEKYKSPTEATMDDGVTTAKPGEAISPYVPGGSHYFQNIFCHDLNLLFHPASLYFLEYLIIMTTILTFIKLKAKTKLFSLQFRQ